MFPLVSQTRRWPDATSPGQAPRATMGDPMRKTRPVQPRPTRAELAQLLDAAWQLYEHSQRPGQLCPTPLTPAQAIADAGQTFHVCAAPHALRLWQLAAAAWRQSSITVTASQTFAALVTSLRLPDAAGKDS